VAAVAQLVCQWATKPVETDTIIQACLVHDMGNIVKFKLDVFPEFSQPEGVAYWQQIQAEFVAKYGSRSHDASLAIAQEMRLSPRVVELIDCMSLNKTRANFESHDLNKIICEYADDRVAPQGVVTLDERLADFARRYADHYRTPADQHRQQTTHEYARLCEETLFAHSQGQPWQITDAAIAPLLNQLRQVEI
jgi:hypothetical protein